MRDYILALDQGTTSSRALLFDHAGQVCGSAARSFAQYYPQEGWVEQDAEELWQSQRDALRELLENTGVQASQIAAIGIANQRETTLLWERETGRPLHRAIVWQCRRTAPLVEELRERGLADYIKQTTGLVPDAYFSATKLRWLLDAIPRGQQRAERGELCFGTVDSWLLWQLTQGAVHATDETNAARTMLFDIHKRCWDERLLQEMNIPRALLPQVRQSSAQYGTCQIEGLDAPIGALVGDQQAALFGQGCFAAGEAKNTYGTGCFLLLNTGATAVQSQNGLLTTLAASHPSSAPYALEGSVFIGGALVQWLRDEMGLLRESCEVESLARSVPDNGGVYLVPAFTGLAAPHWDMYARGGIYGLSRGSTRAHIARAAEEAIAYQVYDLQAAMQKDAGFALKSLRVDGGASRDDFLLQFQADISCLPVLRPAVQESTVQGCAYLAGLAVGFWKDEDELRQLSQAQTRFAPEMGQPVREGLLRGWEKALALSRGWAKDE